MDQYNQIIKECDICDANATSLCFKCNQYFCDSCYKLVHGKHKNLYHQKEPIDTYVPINLKCQIHPGNPLSLFCLDEKGKFIF